MSSSDQPSLQARVQSAEQRAKRSQVVASLSLALVGLLVLSGWIGQEDTVTARRFEVVNDAGDVTASLESLGGGGELLLLGDDGRVIDIAAGASAPTGITLFDSDHARMQLSVAEEGNPNLRLWDSSGTVRLAASVLDGGPAIFLADAASTRRAALSQTKAGPSLRLFDETGNPRVGAAVSTDGPLMAVTGPSGRTMWSAP